MESQKVVHLLHVPWTGLGLYGGFRGNRWLRNRIKIFKQFVVPSLQAQTNKNFILWCAWRYEERSNPQVIELKKYLDELGLRNVFTYAGICFWDDKYPDAIAHKRLVDSIHGSMGELLNVIGEADTVLMTIQPSDDCYDALVVDDIQKFFAKNREIHVYGYSRGYVMDYIKQKICEWNPTTTPPFYTIRFPRDIFTDPLKHVQYTGPYKSHEYVKDFLPALYVDQRSFLVGTHGENISTIFNHPFAGKEVSYREKEIVLATFGLGHVEPLKIRMSLRRIIMRKLPHGWQRKLRYWVGERFYHKIYEFLRN